MKSNQDKTYKSDYSRTVATYHEQGFVVVTPEGPKDGGDFGKYTPGTKTAGIQEALSYAKSLYKGPHREKNLYVCKGAYVTTETIRIPWIGEMFRFYAEESWIDYRGTTGDAIVVDSQMNGRLKFGYVSAQNSQEGWVVRLKPEDPGPMADSNLPSDKIYPIMTLTEFYFNAIVVRGAPFPPWKKSGEVIGNGILLDASSSRILWSKIFIYEVNTAITGIYLKGNCRCNWIHAPMVHGCNTSLQIGDAEGSVQPVDNRIDMSISERVPGCVGARIFGQRNFLTLSVYETEPEKNIIFEPEAKDNIVYASTLPNGITNNATTPTNRIISCQPVGFDVTTPPFPVSGKDMVNRNPSPVEIIILTPGTVSDWTLTDSKGTSQTVHSTLLGGQHLILEPGDKIRFTYKTIPTWKWKALG